MVINYIVMCLIFGTTFLAIKIGIEDGMSPFWFATLRFFIAGALILAFLGWRKQLKRLSFRMYAEIAFVGILMTTIPYASLFWAEQHIASGLAALLVATAPIFTTIIGIVAGQMQFRWNLFVGLVLGIIGTSFVVGIGQGVADDDPLALESKLSIVAAEFFYAIGAIRSKKVMNHVSPFAFNGLQMIFSSCGLFVLSLCLEDIATVTYNLSSVSALLYLSVIASILALGIYYWLLKETNPTFPSTWTYVAPVIAMIVGAIFLDEKLTTLHVIGGCCVLAGIVILNWRTWGEIRFTKNIRKQ
jgi:drug/metabolite transporter (DMT)-like permease